MSAHAFEVLSRARNEIEVCHTAEGHRFKFFCRHECARQENLI